MSKANSKRKTVKKVVTKKVTYRAPEIMLNVISRDQTEAQYQKLEQLYRAAYENTIALAEAQDEKGEYCEMLVAFIYNDETKKIDMLPLARLLKFEELGNYTPPEGIAHGSRTESR